MHEVLVNRLGGLSLPRKSVVRLTDRPDMTLDVYRGRKTTNQQNSQIMAWSEMCSLTTRSTRGLSNKGPIILKDFLVYFSLSKELMSIYIAELQIREGIENNSKISILFLKEIMM